MIKETCVIIGGSSEIGCELAKTYLKKGYNLALTYNSTEIGEDVLNLATEKKAELKTYKLNLKNFSQIDEIYKKISEDFKCITTLVYVAGIAQKRALIFDSSDEEIVNLFDVNIKATIKCVKNFTKMVVNNNSASIVLIGSFNEKVGCSCESIYTATKSAMTGLCKSLASELGNLDIRINVVAPGFIDTKMNNNLTLEEKEEIAEMTPLKRLGTTKDVADLVEFLTSEKSSFITGQAIFVDGGLILE